MCSSSRTTRPRPLRRVSRRDLHRAAIGAIMLVLGVARGGTRARSAIAEPPLGQTAVAWGDPGGTGARSASAEPPTGQTVGARGGPGGTRARSASAEPPLPPFDHVLGVNKGRSALVEPPLDGCAVGCRANDGASPNSYDLRGMADGRMVAMRNRRRNMATSRRARFGAPVLRLLAPMLNQLWLRTAAARSAARRARRLRCLSCAVSSRGLVRHRMACLAATL